MAESSTITRDQTDALAKLAEIPPEGSEERLFWLEAAEQHGFEPTFGGEQIPEYDPPAYFATEDEVLKLLSEARKQGQRDVLAAPPPHVPGLVLPRELTPEVRDVLSIMCFEAGPIAHAFRQAGRAEIKTRAEDEQAFVLHWLLTIALEHGAEWRKHAGDVLEVVIVEAKAAVAARKEALATGGARG
ncbi:hypothetical protein [Methylobacterium brachiatum]|uniref:hypothetical protein n=1 Tax=Methylobacterium brachiatum TaxID=269660 RepID=UPI00244D1BDD|nr:hypothetical protein [Methylobacterium brachiatum]MDH2313386.1 hypothetical protein [Methylobacterium brachiatum]